MDSQQRAGALNLLTNCAALKAGETVLLVREDPAYGYFDAAAPDAVEQTAREIGAEVFSLTTRRIDGPEQVPALLKAAMETVDHTIFFNRIGDQMRFKPLPGPGSKTICYALDGETLGHAFCTTHHGLYTELLRRFQEEIDETTRWRITCPMGTELEGESDPPPPAKRGQGDFTLNLFPVTTFRPIPCDRMSGQVVLKRWVNGTNTHRYEPEVLRFEGAVTVFIEQGRIRDLDGPPEAVEALRRHGRMVGEKFGQDPGLVHSWHGGINPKTAYPGKAVDDPVRWAGVVFASPRYLHFHTAADYAPGEISWHIIDPTVTFDGQVYWQNGRFSYLERPEVKALTDDFKGSNGAFKPIDEIGL
ncbi:MAG: hypothetical protein AAF495_14065 [Pseudomonadota bacterium]